MKAEFHELVCDPKDGTDLWQIDHKLCDECKCIESELGINIDFDPDNVFMYACIGQIVKPENPANHHEEANTVRLCLADSAMQIHIFQYTDWEITRISYLLVQALSYRLFGTQRTPEEIQKKGEKLDE